MINFLLTASAQSKNFAKENVHRIKEIQKANREKQREAMTTEPVKAVYKPGKFDHVDSKVAQEVKVWRALITIILYHHLRVRSHLDCGLIAGYIISLSSGCLFKHLAKSCSKAEERYPPDKSLPCGECNYY